MDTLLLALRIAAVAIVAVPLFSVLGQLAPGRSSAETISDRVLAVVVLVGSHLLITWAWGPWAGAAVLIAGLVWAVEPWYAIAVRRRRRHGLTGPPPEESLHPEMAGTAPAMTADERAAWDDIEQRLTDDGAA